MTINAFVGHSFQEGDREVIRKFLDFFNTVSGLGIGFEWEHAEAAEPKELSIKVKEKMDRKNLFIGICTARQKSIDLEKITSFPFRKDYLWANEREFSVKTSDWILQEIGFAFGRDMKIMILLENGLKTPGGIQGDIEYIPFYRDNPEQSFNKILEMLRSLTVSPVSKGIIDSSETEKTLQQVTALSSDEQFSDKPISEWTIDDYANMLLSSIIKEDHTKEEEIIGSFAGSSYANEPNNLAKWNAYRWYLNMEWKKENRLDQLIELMQANPDNMDVLHFVAQSYELYNEYERAAYYFEKCASGTENIKIKITRLGQASLARAKSGELDKANILNKQCISITHGPDREFGILYTSLADVAKESGNNDDYKAFTEALLELYPEDHYRRFSLAYKYAEDGEHDMALYHYRILSERNPDSTNWNNLGATLDNLKLPALSVSSYRQAEKMEGSGKTLAMSNLAHKFINAGFLEEAKELSDRAISIIDYDQRIGEAISTIREMKNKEEKEHARIIDSFKKVRQFYIDYSNAYIKEDLQTILPKWQGPKCKLQVSLNQGVFEAIGDYEKPKPWYSAPSSSQKQETAKEYIKYVGKVNGHCIKYKYWISDKEFFNLGTTKPNGSGFMIVEDQLQRILLHDSASRDDASFSEMIAFNDNVA
jgi:tetratricopeptide (TPR) repeat protein